MTGVEESVVGGLYWSRLLAGVVGVRGEWDGGVGFLFGSEPHSALTLEAKLLGVVGVGVVGA